MLYICSNRDSGDKITYEKVSQDLADVDGRIITWGFEKHLISPTALEDLQNGVLKNTIQGIGTMEQGNYNAWIELPRMVMIERIQWFGDYLRLDMRLVQNPKHTKNGVRTKPARGTENYLVSY